MTSGSSVTQKFFLTSEIIWFANCIISSPVPFPRLMRMSACRTDTPTFHCVYHLSPVSSMSCPAASFTSSPAGKLMSSGYFSFNSRYFFSVTVGFLKKLPAVPVWAGSGNLVFLIATISATACLSGVASFTFFNAKITAVINTLFLSSCLKMLSRYANLHSAFLNIFLGATFVSLCLVLGTRYSILGTSRYSTS